MFYQRNKLTEFCGEWRMRWSRVVFIHSFRIRGGRKCGPLWKDRVQQFAGSIEWSLLKWNPRRAGTHRRIDAETSLRQSRVVTSDVCLLVKMEFQVVCFISFPYLFLGCSSHILYTVSLVSSL